jgi:hypothetical protein
MDALAFERAARLFRLALKLEPRAESAAKLRAWRIRLGDALAHAGRGPAAARAHLDAVPGATAAEALDLQRRAAQQLLVSGHIVEGLQSRGLLLALAAGERYRLARSLAIEIGFVATTSPRGDKFERTLKLADEVAGQAGDPHARGLVYGGAGIGAFLRGDFAESLRLCEAGEAIFREQCTAVSWELATVKLFAARSLMHMGDVAQLLRRVPVAIKEARERGDLFGETSLRAAIMPFLHLARDAVADAEREADDALSRWHPHGFQIQHYYQLASRVAVDLYRGDAARAVARLQEEWPRMRKALLFRVQLVYLTVLDLRGRAALAAARAGGGRDGARRTWPRRPVTRGGSSASACPGPRRSRSRCAPASSAGPRCSCRGSRRCDVGHGPPDRQRVRWTRRDVVAMRVHVYLLPLACLALVSACYDGARAARDLNPYWRGHARVELEARLGTPSEAQPQADGTTLLRWTRRSRRVEKLPSGGFDLKVTENSVDLYAEVRPGEVKDVEYTMATAVVDPQGTVLRFDSGWLAAGIPRGLNVRTGAIFGLHGGMGRLDDAATALPGVGVYVGGMLGPRLALLGAYAFVNGSDDGEHVHGHSWALAVQYWPATRLAVRAGPAMVLDTDPGLANPTIAPGVVGALSFAVIRSGSFVLDLRFDATVSTQGAFGMLGVGVNVN